MPISATANQSEQHWADVQKLLHRAIDQAGFQPVNVWASELTDRVSERIIGNIFSHDIVVADISDLNPNVMLELGLRLSSKKPTVAIVNSGGTIPFDIRDFHVISYPADLNILGMESFFETIKHALQSKHQAFARGDYTPFLGDIVIEVISPETRPVPAEELLLARLDDLGARLGRIERQTATAEPQGTSRVRVAPRSHGRFYLDIRDADDEFMDKLEALIDNCRGMVSVQTDGEDGFRRLRVSVYEPTTISDAIDRASAIALAEGARVGDVRVTRF